jgi:hypothetical protein
MDEEDIKQELKQATEETPPLDDSKQQNDRCHTRLFPELDEFRESVCAVLS